MANYFEQFQNQQQGAGTAPAPDPSAPAAAAPEGTKITATVSGNPGVMGTLYDIGKGLLGGAVDAAQGTLNAPADIAEMTGAISPETGANVRKALSLPEISAQETTLGGITRSVTRFVGGFIGAGKIMAPIKALQGASKAATVVRGLAQGAVGDFLVSDPHEARLANFAQDLGLGGDIAEYMAAKPTDGRAEGRLKAALEGVVLGGMVEAALIPIRAWRAARALRAAGKSAEADKVLAEAGAQADTALTQATREPNGPLPAPAPTARQEVQNAAKTGEAKLIQLSDEDREVFRHSLIEHLRNGSEFDPDLAASVLNYKKMSSPDAIKSALDEMAAVASTELKHSGGTFRSLAGTTELAETLGEKPAVLMARLRELAESTEKADGIIVAGKTLAQSVARDVATLALRINNGLGAANPALMEDFAHKSNILTTLIEHLSGAQTSMARATGAGRIVTAAEITPELVAKIRMAGGDVGGIIRVLKAPKELTTAAKVIDFHNYFWMNGILSGVKTNVINITSTAMNSLVRPAQRVAGGLLTGDMRQAREGMYQYAALRHTLFDSFDMARRAFTADHGFLDQGASAAGEMRGWTQQLMKADPDENASVIANGLRWLGRNVVGLPGKFLNAEDEFFKQMNYRSHVMAEAWADGAERGFAGADLKAFVNERMTDAFTADLKGTNKAAKEAAQHATFTQDLNVETWTGGRSVSQYLSEMANANPWIRSTVLPFIKVPANLTRQFIDSGPSALVRKQFWEDLAAGGERKAMALGKLSTGSALWVGAGYLAAEGKITGGGPQDKDLLRSLRATGWQPYSFVFNNDDGTKSYMPFARLDPFGMFFGLAADLHEVAGKANQGIIDDLAVSATTAVASNMASKTYLRGLIDLMGVVGSVYNRDEAAKKYIYNRVASYVPSITSVANPDDSLKEVRTMMDAIRARIPGLSSSVEAKRDNFGQKFVAPGGYPYSALNPFAMTTTANDTVREEMLRLSQTAAQARFPLPEEKLHGAIDLTTMRKVTGQTAYDRWLELLGEMKLDGKTMHQSLGELMQTDSYKQLAQAMGDGSHTYKGSLAVEMVKKRMDLYKDQALLKLQGDDEFPALQKAIIDYKVNSAKSRVLGPGAIEPNPLIKR